MVRSKIRRAARRCGGIHNYFDFILVAGILLILGTFEAGLLRDSLSVETVQRPGLRNCCFLLALCAPLLLLPPRWNRAYTWIFLPAAAGSVLLQIFLEVYYGLAVGESLVTILMVSSPGESLEYFGELLFSWKGVEIIGAAAALLLLCRLSCALKFSPGRREKIAGILLLLPFLALSAAFCFENRPREILNCATLTRLGVALGGYRHTLDSFAQAAAEPEIPLELRRSAPGDLLGVIVIGESATRSHHSLYGYRRRTNPRLEAWKNELILFDDVISPTVHTASSLVNVFSFATLQERNSPRCSFTAMARRAGLRTVLVSNQLRWGEFDTPITLMFKDVDDAYYLKEQVADSRDDQLLPEVEKKLGEAGGIPTLLFIHLLGSHMPFRHRYPAEAALFPAPGETADPHIPATVRQLTAEYDNSIAFTDRLLDALLSRLKTLKRPAFLLYFSDHGEAFYPGMSDWVARDPDVNASYEIPFLLWFSPEYRKARPEAAAGAQANRHQPHQTDRLIYTLLELAGITYRDFPQEESLLNPGYRPHPRFIHEGKIPYSKKPQATELP